MGPIFKGLVSLNINFTFLKNCSKSVYSYTYICSYVHPWTFGSYRKAAIKRAMKNGLFEHGVTEVLVHVTYTNYCIL